MSCPVVPLRFPAHICEIPWGWGDSFPVPTCPTLSRRRVGTGRDSLGQASNCTVPGGKNRNGTVGQPKRALPQEIPPRREALKRPNCPAVRAACGPPSRGRFAIPRSSGPRSNRSPPQTAVSRMTLCASWTRVPKPSHVRSAKRRRHLSPFTRSTSEITAPASWSDSIVGLVSCEARSKGVGRRRPVRMNGTSPNAMASRYGRPTAGPTNCMRSSAVTCRLIALDEPGHGATSTRRTSRRSPPNEVLVVIR